MLAGVNHRRRARDIARCPDIIPIRAFRIGPELLDLIAGRVKHIGIVRPAGYVRRTPGRARDRKMLVGFTTIIQNLVTLVNRTIAKIIIGAAAIFSRAVAHIAIGDALQYQPIVATLILLRIAIIRGVDRVDHRRAACIIGRGDF